VNRSRAPDDDPTLFYSISLELIAVAFGNWSPTRRFSVRVKRRH
jgi:hypothetical protein